MGKNNCIKSILLMLALLMSATATAYDFEVDGIYYTIIGSTNNVYVTYKIFNNNSYSGNITIPENVTFNGEIFSVTSIGAHAFYGCTGLTSIDIPNSVTSIGGGAFYGCTGLTNIDIPNYVTSINNSTFDGCTGLTSIDIPNSVTSIGGRAFYGCTGLTNIDIPNSVTSIGVAAFEETSWFNNQSDGLVYAGSVAYKYKGTMQSGTNIALRNGSLGIAEYAFSNCSNLTNIEIPNSVVSIGQSAFAYCSNLTNIEIPSSVASIGSNPFMDCIGLKNISVASDNPYYDSRNNCNAIIETASNALVVGCQKTIIPNSIISFSQGAFRGCKGLTSIEIPNSVTSINHSTFSGCENLIKIVISNSVTYIGHQAFFGCSSLQDIYCYAPNPPTCQDNSFENSLAYYSATLHVPSASLAAYFTAPYWENFENIVGDAIAPTEITINKDSVDLHLEEQLKLTATVYPVNASNIEVTWVSTDTTVATVNNGMVYAVGYGECDIIASCFGMQAICHVSVVNQITLDQQEAMLLPNHILTLTPTPIIPEIYVVSSSDPTVAAARVVSGGKVQVVGIKEGTTIITVGSADGTAIPAACLVTVYTEPGDLNSDGFVAIGDVTLLIDYLLGSDEISVSTKNADVDSDGNISIKDVAALIDILLSGTTD